jgi:3-oxoadipate enol-lactonase
MTPSHTLSIGGDPFAVHIRGSGIPLVLLHAFPLDHGMWEAQEPLADSLRLIVPDQRGFGGSAAAAPITSIAGMADDVVAVLDALHVGEPAVVCGVSMGGYVAQHVAARHPHRVRGLILCDTKLEADTPEARDGRAVLAEKVGRVGTSILADAMLSKLLAASAEARSAPRRPAIEERLRQLIAGQPVPTVQASLMAMAGRPDMTDAMRRTHLPTLLVVGAEDSFTPPETMQRMESIIPRSRLLIVPRAGHLVPVESPDLFNAAVLEFLREVAAADAVRASAPTAAAVASRSPAR